MKNKIKEILSNRKMTADLIAKDNLKKAFLLHGFKKLYVREKEIIIQRARIEVEEMSVLAIKTESQDGIDKKFAELGEKSEPTKSKANESKRNDGKNTKKNIEKNFADLISYSKSAPISTPKSSPKDSPDLSLRNPYENEIKKLTIELQEVYKKQDEILKTANLTRKDLIPQYTCPICEDTGFKNGIDCDCVNKIISELNLERLNLKRLKTFKDCDYSIFKNVLIPKFYKKMQIWTNSQRKKTSVVLQGDVGTGKTFLLECIANEFIKQNKYVIFATAFEMNNDFLKYHTIFSEAKMAYLNKYHECEILIIDDLGSEPILRNVTKEYLYLIINQRMIENKTTLISTNLGLVDIRDRYGERTFSRLVNKQQNILFKFENEDLRKRRL